MNHKRNHQAPSQAGAHRGEAISIQGISKHYGDVAAVNGVNLDVHPGEFLSLLGPSGSGKTSLLMMLAGFETPSTGSIALAGRDLTHVPPNKRGIGMVFQSYALFPHMTVAENIAFPLKMRKVKREEIGPRVEHALTMVRLAGYGGRMPSQLSGGQQQRVAVARALVFEPPVLLMDEPLGALDKKLREELQIEIKTLHQEVGVTIIYVTHDQEEALTLSDRIAVMNNGRIEQLGSPQDLYHSPQNSFVADFIGKMNFIKAKIATVRDGQIAISVGGANIEVPKDRFRSSGEPVPDQAAVIAVRPELLEIATKAAKSALAATVETTIFVGAYTTYVLRIADGTSIQVQTDRNDVLPQGATVALRLAGDTLHLFQDEN